MDAWQEFIVGFLKVLKEDDQLHTAAVHVLEAHAEAEEARADHERALAEKARARR